MSFNRAPEKTMDNNHILPPCAPSMTHEYFIDGDNVGFCRHCEQKVQFSADGRQPPRLITAGKYAEQQPETVQWRDNKQAYEPVAESTKPAENIPAAVTEPEEKLTESLTRPKKPSGRGLVIQNFYNEHKAEILADLEKYGEKKMLELWDLNLSYWRYNMYEKLTGKPYKHESLPGSKTRTVKCGKGEIVALVEEIEQDEPTSEAAAPEFVKSADEEPKMDIIVSFWNKTQLQPLPPYPEFSNDWEPELQIVWMDHYYDFRMREYEMAGAK